MYWYDLRYIDHDSLSEARNQVHYAMRWLGRAARAFSGPEPGTGSSGLSWYDVIDGYVTPKIAGCLVLGLRVEDLTYFSFVDGRFDSEFCLDGIDDAAARDWVAEKLQQFKIDPGALFVQLESKPADHPLGEGASYDRISEGHALIELSRWLCNGRDALVDLTVTLKHQGLAATPVRCWPDNFTVSTVIRFGDQQRQDKRLIRVGLSPGDEHRREPYFFVSPRPYLHPENLPPFRGIGSWQVNGSVDAVAPASDFVGSDQQALYVRDFLASAVSVGCEQLVG